MDLLRAVENSGFGILVRESGSMWSYPTIIFLHAVGLTFVAGVNAALDLRLLGFAPRLPIASMEGLFPVIRHRRRARPADARRRQHPPPKKGGAF